MIKKFLPIACCILASLLFLPMSAAYAEISNRTIYNYTDEFVKITWQPDQMEKRGCVIYGTSSATTCQSYDDTDFRSTASLIPSRDGFVGTPSTYAIKYISENYCFAGCTQEIRGHMVYTRPDGTKIGFGVVELVGVRQANEGAYLRGDPTWINETINGKAIRIVANASGLGGNVMICFIGKPPCTNYAERTVYNNTDFPVQIQWTPDTKTGNNGFIGFRTKNFGDFSNAANATINPHEKWTVVYQAGATGALDGWVQFPQTGSGTNFQGWGVGLYGDNNPQLKGSTFCSRVGNVNLRFGNAYQDPDSKNGANGGIEIINC